MHNPVRVVCIHVFTPPVSHLGQTQVIFHARIEEFRPHSLVALCTLQPGGPDSQRDNFISVSSPACGRSGSSRGGFVVWFWLGLIQCLLCSASTKEPGCLHPTPPLSPSIPVWVPPEAVSSASGRGVSASKTSLSLLRRGPHPSMSHNYPPLFSFPSPQPGPGAALRTIPASCP